MVKRLVVKTSSAEVLLKMTHELGKIFICPISGSQYKAVYFAHSTNVFFEGTLSNEELKKLQEHDCLTCKQIEVDEFDDEILIRV